MFKMLRRLIGWLIGTIVVVALVVVVVAGIGLYALIQPPSDKFGTVDDEAKRAGLSREDLKVAYDPYFVEMDKGDLLPPDPGQPHNGQVMEVVERTKLEPETVRQAAIAGQNMWMVWTGGNDRFWDFAARRAIGSFDLLKIISSHKDQAYGRHNRFRYLGVVNEPCFEKATGPNPARFGLWLDTRDENCALDPFADAEKYPGIKIPQANLKDGEKDARGKPSVIADKFPESTIDGKMPVGSYYGEPTGVIGLRLFPNPDFDDEAARNWDPERFYTDPDYYGSADLVRPYRVGMSCAFCHAGPNPVNPPKDVENPQWSELTSNPGAQYYWVNRVFFWNTAPRDEEGTPSTNEGNFLYQIFHTNPPGSLDTSLVSTDYMNNPRTMNAVYDVLARLDVARETGREILQGGERDNKQFQDYKPTEAFAPWYDEASGESFSMRVLKDGADSVGGLGALNRVYINIGLFSEEWLLHFIPFLGGQKISPIKIADAQRNSVFWQATEDQSPYMAVFFLVSARADKLKDAPGGEAYLATESDAKVERGKVVFAETCAACHSSKQPEPDPSFGVDAGICEGGGAGPNYRECWERYWTWARSDQFKEGMRRMIRDPDFLTNNFLSTERRVPIDVLQTNACSAIATNGLKGDIWDNFTSSTYKTLPPPGEISVHHPVSGAATPFQALGNGRGYIRPASLISLWSTGPYLLNNSVGHEEKTYSKAYYAAGRPTPPKSDYADTETDDTDADNTTYTGTQPGTADQDTKAVPAAGTNETTATEARYQGGYDGYGQTQCPSADPEDPYMPCVANRVAVFKDSVRKLISPDLRRKDRVTTEAVPGYIYRTTAPSCLIVPPGFMPEIVREHAGTLNWLAPWAITEAGGLELGPFPKDFPVNALVNTKILPDNDEPDMFSHLFRLAGATPTLLGSFKKLGGQCSPAELADSRVIADAERTLRETGLIDTLVGLSKCPDYVVNKGHTFGAHLGEEDREALIAYLMHF